MLQVWMHHEHDRFLRRQRDLPARMKTETFKARCCAAPEKLVETLSSVNPET